MLSSIWHRIFPDRAFEKAADEIRNKLLYRSHFMRKVGKETHVGLQPTLKFVRDPDYPDFPDVPIDIRKFDAFWQHDEGFYIGPHSSGIDPQKIPELIKWIQAGNALEMPVIGLRETSPDKYSASFVNGRHRFVVAREMGLVKIPVMISAEEYPALIRLCT